MNQTRFFDYFNYLPKRKLKAQIVDVVGPTHLWPRQLQRLFYHTPHLKNRDRFTLVVFLMNNGVDPRMIESFFAKGNYDSGAYFQVSWVIKAFPRKNWKSWVVSQGRSL